MTPNNFFSRFRINLVILFLLLSGIYIILQYGKFAFMEQKKISPQRKIMQRGSIFDKNGKSLAVQTKFYHLGINPSETQDMQNLSNKLYPVLGMSKNAIEDIINKTPSKFLYLKKRLDQNQKEQIDTIIQENQFFNLRFDTIPGRLYPENALASQLIGFMGDSGKGLSGVEYSMESILMPEQNVDEQITRGNDIFLTIDANLQYKLEQIGYKAMKETQAESFMLIAAEVQTGEILSYISLPSANLNTYTQALTEEKIDRPAVLAYEPGSVFKIFSVASFVDQGAISPEEQFYCDGKHEIIGKNGEKVVITCLGKHGFVTAREALQYSCNDALAQMSEKMSSQEFLRMIRQFGFGARTGIELPSETRGSVKTVNDPYWSLRSKPTMAIGQEIAVSALQILQGTLILANKGIPLNLSIISKIVDANGKEIYTHKAEPKTPIITPSTADYVLSCMETTARFGTGTRAVLGDISIGVKTGTAQMLDPKTGRYSETDFVSNCAAVFPIDQPEIALYIVITKAKGETYSGRIVAPLIGEAANIIIDHLGLARAKAASFAHSGKVTFATQKTPEIDKTVPDFTGLAKRLLTPLLARKDINFLISGEGWVVSQNPPPNTPITQGMTIELYLEQ